MHKIHIIIILYVLIFLKCTDSCAQASDRLEQLGKSMSTIRSDTERIRVLGDAVWDLQSKNPKLADSIALVELKYGDNCPDLKYKADAYNDAGMVKYRLGDFPKCKEYYLKSLDIRTKNGDQAGIGSILGKLGALYQKTGDLNKALECQLQCLQIQEKLHNQINIAQTYNNIAVIHSNQKNYRKAIEYAGKALAINQPKYYKNGLVVNYNTMAIAYINLEIYDSALMLLDSVASLAGQIGDKYTTAAAYCNIGNTYEHKQNLPFALQYYLKALDLAKGINNKAAIAMYSLNVGDNYRRQAQYGKAEPYLLTSYQISKELKQKPVIAASSLALYQIYKHSGDLTKASGYVEEAMAVKDSIFNEESSKQIAEMQTKYETNKKEQQLEIQRLQVNRRNILLIILSIVFVLIVVIGWLSYHRYRLSQKALMNAEMLKQQQLRAKAILDAEEQERRRIGQDLHDGVGQILSAAKLNLSSLQSVMATPNQSDKDKMQNALDLLDESVKEVRIISHNMMPNMLIKSGLAAAVRDFVNKMKVDDKLKMDLDIVGMDKRLDGIVEAVLFRVFQEILNNIMRHSEASQVTIQLLQHDKEIVMMIEDNGKGFDVGNKMRNENGIGLKSITSRVGYLHGTVHFDSTPGRGTTVTVEIPIANETDNS